MSDKQYIVSEKESTVFVIDSVTREQSYGDTEADATRHLEEKNYMMQELAKFNSRPLSEQEQKDFVEWLNENIATIWLSFKRNHIIYEDDFRPIGVRVIVNHVELVQKALIEYSGQSSLSLCWCRYLNRYSIIDKNRKKSRYEELIEKHFS